MRREQQGVWGWSASSLPLDIKFPRRAFKSLICYILYVICSIKCHGNEISKGKVAGIHACK